MDGGVGDKYKPSLEKVCLFVCLFVCWVNSEDAMSTFCAGKFKHF